MKQYVLTLYQGDGEMLRASSTSAGSPSSGRPAGTRRSAGGRKMAAAVALPPVEVREFAG